MRIRHYQPGDEETQAAIYNAAAGALPAFKPATAEEVARRYRTTDPDPASKLYAEEGGRVVGYAVFNPNGRVSYPWCLPEAQGHREPLLEALLSEMRRRGVTEAWAAYRADWGPVLAFLQEHGFARAREMANYVAEVGQLPRAPVPPGQFIARLEQHELPQVLALGRGVFPGDHDEPLKRFFWENPLLDPGDFFALKRADGTIRGAALVVGNRGYADPTKIDAAMPCFRLGALGTERERHKRINGMVSCVFDDEEAGEVLLAEAAARLEKAGLAHAAAQAPSDVPGLCPFYDRFFRRQGSFPILIRRLDASR
jgi:L-amino acid N-acyltransferase YncA